MSCYHPLKGFKMPGGGWSSNPRTGFKDLPMDVPCGQCIGCKLDRSVQWAVRLMHENMCHHASAFITLTYADEHLPYRGMLVKRDFQLFMKLLRKEFPWRIAYYHCGEYGDENYRPHYHAIVFGVDFPGREPWAKNERGEQLYTSPLLSSLWPHGLAVFGDVTFESCAYVARYCVKKVTGQQALHHYQRVDMDTGEIYWLPPEYATMSLRPAIGAEWFKRFGAEIEGTDSVVMRGAQVRVPRYYDKQRDKEKLKVVKKKRLRKAFKRPGELSPSRLAVKETIKKAQLSMLKRRLK